MVTSDFKRCTKCSRDLPVDRFGPWRNKCGLYPSCRECETKKKREYVQSITTCARCKNLPCTKSDIYCPDCARAARGRPARKWVSRRDGLEWCKLCEAYPRLPYHHYCHECKKKHDTARRPKQWALRHPTDDLKRIATNRAYATGLLQRGKIKRGPCVFCGAPGTQFHHYDYEPRTRNFEDVCLLCHVQAHQYLNFLLTAFRNGAIRLPAP